MNEAVILKISDGIALLTLNRPEDRNCMSEALLEAFQRAIGVIKQDTSVRCLVITGKGDCFSAGAKLKDDDAGTAQLSIPSRLPHEGSFAMYEPFLGLRELDIPVVAALNGHAVGGGFGLSLMCDIRIANADAKYGANFARLGICSGMGISYILPRLVGVAHASEMLFTGQLVRGARAAEMGLMSQALEASQVLPTAITLAQQIAESAPVAVQMMKRAMRRGLAWQLRDAAMYEAHMQAASLSMHDAKEGVAAVLGKRKGDFHGR